MPPNNPVRLPLPFLRWRGFTLQFFLFTILPLTLLLLVVTFGSLELHHSAMRDLVGDRDLRAVRAAATSLENEFAHRSALITLAVRNFGQGENLSDLFARQDALQMAFEGGLAHFAPDGKLLESVGPAAAWQQDLAPADLAALISGEWILVEQQTGDALETWLLAGGQTSNGELIAGAFSPQMVIQETVDPSFDTRHTTVAIVGGVSQARLLYYTGPPFLHEPFTTHPGIAEVIRGESGIRYDSTGHHEQVIAFAPIAGTGWGLVISEAWEDISNPLLRTTQLAPLILVPVLLLALLALWFGARSIVQPLQALEARASDLAGGNFAAIREPVGGITEIRNLQEQLIDMAGQLDAAQQSLRSYIGAITAGIESERRSLARELHDDTIQDLIALNQRIQYAAMSPPEKQQAAVDELEPMMQAAIGNLRRTIRGLRPIYLEDLGLVTALEMLARETEQVSGLPVAFNLDGSERRLEGETEMMVYRMVQESFSNILRHAEATRVQLELDFRNDSLQVKVIDDGKGFRVPARSQLSSNGHFGLLGLHERAELIGADLVIISTPGQGTIVSFHIPG
jgi:signal transduction histidine kinase